MTQKSEQLVHLLNDARNEIESLYAALPEAERARQGTWQVWSPKDFLGHFNFWQNILLQTFDTLDQAPPEQEPFDVRNKRNYRHYENAPYVQVYTDFRASLDKIIERVPSFSDEELSEPNHYPRLPNGTLQGTILANTYSHVMGHLAELYAKQGDAARGFDLQEQAAANVMELDPSPRNKGLTLYNLACAYAVANKPKRAIELLGDALKLRPDLVEFSKQDTDFNSVRNVAEFQALYR